MDTVVNFLFLDGNKLFMIAGLIVTALVILEVLSMLVGLSLSELSNALHIDKPHIDKPDVDKGMFSVVAWMNPGHVPFVILFAAFLMAFSLSGFVIQWIALKFIGTIFNILVASPIALIPSIFITRQLSRVIAAIVPREETTAVYLESLEGKVGPVTIQASMFNAGQAKVKDDHGQTHYVRISPEGEDELKIGDDVVLLESSNHVFKARKI